MSTYLLRPFWVLAALAVPAVAAEVPNPAASSDDSLVVTMHAYGAQIYECRADASGNLGWRFREPIATLIIDGKTVGRHFAGPSWELSDGSMVVGMVAAQAPAATTEDIPLLWLEVTSRSGKGQLTDVTSIRRINTQGGASGGACDRAGAFLAAPYSADYAFYRKSD